jgi:integrating conjugative element membrane protein (TIGR03747 family)
VAIEIGGGLVWSELGQQHAARLVEQDLAYIAAAPQSLLVGDAVAFSQMLIAAVRWPYQKLGVLERYARDQLQSQTPPQPQGDRNRGIAHAAEQLATMTARALVITMLVAQDVLLRLAVALFALPAFALACLLGTLDGMVRRDLRRWSGGRESSFIYHHAKHYTLWALTGGFGLYLSWPLGGFNPAYMVLIFTVLVAATLSTTVGAFKKYL